MPNTAHPVTFTRTIDRNTLDREVSVVSDYSEEFCWEELDGAE